MSPATSPASAARTGDRLRTVLAPVVEGAGYDLEDVSVTAAGRRSLVRVIVDADGGVDLDAAADVSRVVSETLDAQAQTGVLAGAYVLEVSSPGVDRPLREPRHWRRNRGRLVTVAVDSTPRTARIAAADDDGVDLTGDAGAERVAYARLGPGRIQVEFHHDGHGSAGEESADAAGEDD